MKSHANNYCAVNNMLTINSHTHTNGLPTLINCSFGKPLYATN